MMFSHVQLVTVTSVVVGFTGITL
jgi:hypothetical protein